QAIPKSDVPRSSPSRASGPRAPAAKAAPKKKSSTHKPRLKNTKTARSARSRRPSPRFRRIRQAFVSSATLKPMALQLLQNRTFAAYAGVEAYARKHSAEDAGSLAWLAAGYAYFLDHQYAKSTEALEHAQAHSGEIGDYVAYYLANSQLQSGHSAQALVLL